MNEGSFSFLSYQSQKYSNRAIQQFEPMNSKYSIKADLLPTIPTSSNSLVGKPELVILLQAAEIERLNDTLELYRAKFKQISSMQAHEDSYQKQSQELISLKDELELKNKKLNEFLSNQSLLQSNGSMTDVNKYVEKIENKYKRALKFIEDSGKVRQELEDAYVEVKRRLTQTEKTFQSFKQASIRQYQLLRQQLESAKRAELSFEIKQMKAEKDHLKERIRRDEYNLSSERDRYEKLLKEQRNRVISATREIERLKEENQEYSQSVEKAEIKYNSIVNERQNALALASVQIERLNSILKQRNSTSMNSSKVVEQLHEIKFKSQEEINLLRRQVQRGRQKNMLYEEEIDRLNSQISNLNVHISSLTSKINQIGLSTEELQTQHRIKQTKLNSEIRNLSEMLSHAEFKYNNDLQQYKAANNSLTRELNKAKEELEQKDQNYHKREYQVTFRLREIQMEMEQLKVQLNTMVEKQKKVKQELRTVVSKGLIQSHNYQRKLDQVTYESRIFSDKAILEQQKILSETKIYYEERIKQLEERIWQYEQKIREENISKSHLFNQNNSLKVEIQHHRNNKENIKQKSVDQLFKEIQKLCVNIKQKDNHIEQLKFEIQSLNDSSKQSLNETLYLRQMMTKMINLIESFEQNRRVDQKSLVTQIQQLFQGQTHLLDEMRYNRILGKSTLDVYGNQSELIKTKDSQIRYLKERMNHLESESNEKQNVEQIIQKSVEVTKQNIDLKETIDKLNGQIKQFRENKQKIQIELERKKQSQKILITEKQELTSRFQAQLDTLNQALFDQKQSQIKNQSSLGLQSYKKFSQRELAVRDQFIKELKESLKLKNDQNLRISLVMQEEVNRNRKLNQEVNELKKSFNQEIFQKIEQLQNSSQECHRLKRKISQLQIQKRNLANENDRLKAEIAFHKQQTSKHESALMNYNQKMPMLNAEFERLQKIISNLKTKNNELIMANHQSQIQIKKNGLQQQKITVLNNQILRLQAQNINISQELNICRLQLGRDSAQERQLEQNNSLFVLLFVEIESLRERLNQKEKEIQSQRRMHLRS